MEILLGVIAVLVALVFGYKRKAEKNGVQALLGETKGKDSQLEISQDEVEAAIKAIDQGIAKIEKPTSTDMSLEERAKNLRDKLK